MKEIINAQIEDVMLGFEDHGILTCMLTLDYGGSCQGFGGYALNGEHTDKWIRGLLKTLEVDTWDDLKGQHVRVEKESGFNGKVLKIGHIIENKWFSPENK